MSPPAEELRVPEFSPAVVRHLRCVLELTQADLASIAGVHRRTVVNFELGRCASAPTRAAIRGALKRRADELTKGFRPGALLGPRKHADDAC